MKAWKSLSLGQVAELQNSGAWGTDPSGGPHDVPVIRTSDIDAFGRIKKRELPLRCIQGKNRERFLVRRGDILVVKSSGSHTNVVTGKPCYVDDESTGVAFSNFLLRLRVHEDIVLSEFLYWYLWSPEILGQVRRMVSTTTYPNLKVKEYQEFAVPVPPLEEQHRIVERIKECLSRVDEIRRLREEAWKEAGAIFPSSLTAQFAEIKDACVTTTVREVTLETRYGTSQKCDTKPHGLAILRIPNIATGGIHRNNLKYCQFTSEERAKLLLQNGDILVVRTNGSPDLVGRCAVVELQDGEEFGFASYLIRIRLDQKKVHPRFLSYFLTSRQGRAAIDRIKRTAAGQYNVNSENLRAITFPLPPSEVQTEIVRRLDEQRRISQQLINEQKELAQSEGHLTQSVLSKAFAGGL